MFIGRLLLVYRYSKLVMALCMDGDWDVYGWAAVRLQIAAQNTFIAEGIACDMNDYPNNGLLCIVFAILGLGTSIMLLCLGPVIDKQYMRANATKLDEKEARRRY